MSGMEAMTAARTDAPVSQRVSSPKSARSPAVCSGTGVRASTSYVLRAIGSLVRRHRPPGAARRAFPVCGRT